MIYALWSRKNTLNAPLARRGKIVYRVSSERAYRVLYDGGLSARTDCPGKTIGVRESIGRVGGCMRCV